MLWKWKFGQAQPIRYWLLASPGVLAVLVMLGGFTAIFGGMVMLTTHQDAPFARPPDVLDVGVFAC